MERNPKSKLVTKLMLNISATASSGLATIASFGAACVAPFIFEEPMETSLALGTTILAYSASAVSTIYFTEKTQETYQELKRNYS